MTEPKEKAERASPSVHHLGSAWESMDGTAIEIATGLLPEDIEALATNANDDLRAEIAAKFAVHYDRVHRDKTHQLTDDLVRLFSRDPSQKVRLRFSNEIKASRQLDPSVAIKLARDELEIAAPILESSPKLSDTDLESIIIELPEPYSIAIGGRQPLSETLTMVLLEHKGTTKVVSRLIENGEAALSDTALASLYEWGRSDVDIATRLERRPNLPFEMIQKFVGDLGEQLKWKAIITRTMTKGETSQLLGQINGASRSQFPRNGIRRKRMVQKLKNHHISGTLKPYHIIAFLRDNNVDLVELSLTVATGLELRRIRNLLYGSDRRGLVALCLKVGFTTAEYLAFRMILGLVEMSVAVDRAKISYDDETTRFAQAQFDAMRNQPGLVEAWMVGRPITGVSAHP